MTPTPYVNRLEIDIRLLNARIAELESERDRLREALLDSQLFIAAIADATSGAGRIDENSIMRHGERLKTTAKKLSAKNRAALKR